MLMTTLLLAAQIGAAAPASAPSPAYAALVSPAASTRYAFQYGCLAARRAGTTIEALNNPYIRVQSFKGPVLRSYRMTGAGTVYLVDGAGCHLQVSHGDSAKLREAVLDALAADGPLVPVASPSPSDVSTDEERTEVYCLSIAGRPTALTLRTALKRQQPRLLAHLGDGGGLCAGQAPLSRIPDSR